MLALELVEDGRYQATDGVVLPNVPVVFGGQLLAQLTTAASLALDGRRLTSLHAVFPRPALLGKDLFFDTVVLSAGRNAGSVRVTCHQGGSTCVEALALALAPQDLPVGHGLPMPEGAGRPGDATPMASGLDVVELRRVGPVDPHDPEVTAPPETLIWARPLRAISSVADAQSLLAFASEPIVAGVGLLPHPGWAITQVNERFVSAVLSQSLSFHEDPTTDGWWLITVTSPHVNGGRIFGRADVHTEDGRHVASFTQENLLRPLP